MYRANSWIWIYIPGKFLDLDLCPGQIPGFGYMLEGKLLDLDIYPGQIPGFGFMSEVNSWIWIYVSSKFLDLDTCLGQIPGFV